MDRLDISDTHQMSRAKLRKTTKPLLEKKRRARINSSLAQLKTLVLEAVKKDTARYSKLEKADVLDMTVRHLRAIQSRQLAAAMAADPSVLSKFRAGFSECVAEVSRYLSTIDGLEPEVRMRLMEHLATCMERRVTQQVAPPVNVNMLQPIHIQIPPSAPRPGTLPGSYQPMTSSSQTGSSPPIGSLPPQLQTVAMETAHPLLYGVSANVQNSMVTGSFHMIPNSMLYQDRLQSPPKSEPHKPSLSVNKATDIKTSPVATSSPRAHRELVTSRNMVKQEPVWRPW